MINFRAPRRAVLVPAVAALSIGGLGLGVSSASAAITEPHSAACLKLGKTTRTQNGLSIVIPTTYVSRGSRGVCVYYVQELLTSGGAPVAEDGIFGPETEAAVKRAHPSGQKDGIVGPKTWYNLMIID